MPKHMTIINLACTITKLRKWGQAWKYSAESAQNAASQLTAEHERKLTEHRAAFGARTEADAKIIEALREQVELANGECNVLRALTVDTAKYKEERDALRAEVAALQERLRASIARGDLAQMKVAALKSQTPKHPVKVGEWVKRLNPIVLGSGTIAKVLSINENDRPPTYTVEHIDGNEEFWFISNCEPCDPPEATRVALGTSDHASFPFAWSCVKSGSTQWVEEMRGNTEATHDTEAGKAAAAAAVKTEPDEIKVGDVVEVFQATCTRWTSGSDVGLVGPVVRQIVREGIPTVTIAMHTDQETVALRDVRKVTT